MREEELKLEKVKKSCNVTAKVAKVLETILIVGAVLCIVGGVICFCYRNQIDIGASQVMSQEDSAEFSTALKTMDETSFGGLFKFTFKTDSMIEDGQYGMLSAISCFIGAIVCGMVAVVFDMLRRIFKTIKSSETPFTEEVLVKLKRMFIIITVELLVVAGGGAALFAGLICWSVYNILDYGFTLQKQVDETL